MTHSERFIAGLIKVWHEEGLLHTLIACKYKPYRMLNYLNGKHSPHYPVPTTIGVVQVTQYAAYFYNAEHSDAPLQINHLGERYVYGPL